MYTNKDHRQRQKERFRKEGLEHFHELHVLELLLFYAIPQKDTKPLARELLNRFGSLPAVLEASAQELQTVPGVGVNIATYLNLITAAGRYYQTHRETQIQVLDSTQGYGDFLLKRFYGRRNETVFLLMMDAKYKLLSCQLVGEGDVNSANIPVRRMVEMALGANATYVVLAHNHPSGFALPSREDIASTENLATALGAMDIVLLDHIVVADEDYVSMAESRFYNPRNFCR